ncbi:hypothetical protein [Streptomyces sp. NPDC102360]|uniref:hypothetical protein n=1 Tax=Streptomyces sp. NPDC102360 TaxID=3366160 RepID=UPI00382AF27A
MARSISDPDLTLGAALVQLESRDREITAGQETVRPQIAELSTLPAELDQEAANVTTIRQTPLSLPGPEPASPAVPEPPAYE